MAEEKLKILYLMRILLRDTDKDHILNAEQLCKKLEAEYEMTCNRKTIYADIERLQRYGLAVKQVKGDRQGYFVDEREFSLPELKLLVDAVQSSKFISKDKSRDLIKKLETFTSKENARQLQRDVFIYNRIKSENPEIYQNIDLLHAAMAENRQICFQYCEWTIKKELVPRKNGKIYEVSPWALTWDDENYYLVGYDQESDKIKHYRVDKMKSMSLSEKKRAGKDNFENFDLASYARKTFGMYGGRDESVLLRGEKSLVGVILDRFGKNAMIMPDGEDHFKTDVLVTVSPQFFGWVTAIGDRLQIIGPEDVREGYKNYLQDIMNAYL